MKHYKVIVTPEADKELKEYIAYLRNVKKNPQAVRNVLNDFKDTKTSLSSVAGSFFTQDRSIGGRSKRFHGTDQGAKDGRVIC